MSFFVVAFKDSQCVEYVPESWLKGQTVTFWPRVPSFEVSKLRTQMVIPSNDWEQHKIKILSQTDDESTARRRCKRAEKEDSNLSTDIDRKRRRTETERYGWNSDAFANSTPKRKNSKYQNKRMPEESCTDSDCLTKSDSSEVDENLPPLPRQPRPQFSRQLESPARSQDSVHAQPTELVSPQISQRIGITRGKASSFSVMPEMESPVRSQGSGFVRRNIAVDSFPTSSLMPENQFTSSTEQQMRELLRRRHIPIRDEATFIIQCKAMERQNEIMLRLNRLERRGIPHAEVIPMDLPVFTAVEDLKKIPTELTDWMMREGGANCREFVFRILGKLISPALQQNLNRTGSAGKHKFPSELETIVKNCALRLFAGVTNKEVEHFIVRFLKNAADRGGSYSRKRPSEH